MQTSARRAAAIGVPVLVTASVLAAVAFVGVRPPARPSAAAVGPQMPATFSPALVRRLAEEGGPVPVWVFLADKGVTAPTEIAAAVSGVAAAYEPRAVQRRLMRGSPEKRSGQLFDEHDLPVPPAYIEAVVATGARVRVVSRWLNALSVQATRDQLERIAALPCVTRLAPVARARRIEPVNAAPVASLSPPAGGTVRGRLDYGLATGQLTQINLIALHDAGYTGQGIIVGILDTGFHRTHAAFNNPDHPVSVVAEWDFINNDPNTDNEPGDPDGQNHHGTYILGTLGSYLPGELVGGAFDASFILCKTEDISSETPVEEDYYVGGLEFIEAHGGDVATSSLSYIDWYTQADLDGQTAVTTLAVNLATANGVHCCTAASNSGNDADPGTSHLGAPADAFQVITCGAVYAWGEITWFSSDGPTADGRVKPELLAQGWDTATVDPSYDAGYSYVGGTSLSTPLVAGAVACLTQAHPEWTVDQLRAALFQTASDFVANGTYDPLYVRGYGILNAHAAAQDCNGNGTPDSYDLASGASTDVNNNGTPDECESVGDLNCDGTVNFADINPFVLFLSNNARWLTEFPGCDPLNGDINGDGTYGDGSFGDINPFVALLTGK